MFKFEKVSRFEGVDIAAPIRKTENSACYDMVAAEDTIILPYSASVNVLGQIVQQQRLSEEVIGVIQKVIENQGEEAANQMISSIMTCSLDEVSELTKITGIKPALVPTGYKAYMDKGYSLDLYVRSSSPLKYWLIMANSTGIIDADYVDNPDNEGEIFFQLINLLPFPIKIRKGEIIGQAKFVKYQVTDDDAEQEKAKRVGGFGSTSEVVEEITPEIIEEKICS
jgi:dUTP pyrophosphatase